MSRPEARLASRNAAGSYAGRLPWWVPALTAGLLAIGFTRARYVAPPALPDTKQRSRRAPREHGRGRLASTPSQIPARGWNGGLLRVWHNIRDDRIMLVAAGVTFHSLLAIFPELAPL